MKELGRGSFGVVYTDGRHAFKFFHGDGLNVEFSRVARVLLQLQQSFLADTFRPALRRVFSYSPATPCIMMPLYASTLHTVPIKPSETASLARFLISCAETFQSLGICYRDFKPANVCRNKSSFVLIDIDSAFFLADALKEEPTFGTLCPFFGQPHKAIPECLYTSWFHPDVSILTMWYSAACMTAICQDSNLLQYYLPTENFTPGLKYALSRVYDVFTFSLIWVDPIIIDNAVAALQAKVKRRICSREGRNIVLRSPLTNADAFGTSSRGSNKPGVFPGQPARSRGMCV